MQEVNFQDLIKAAGDAGFTVLPKGWYDVVVDSAEPGEIGQGDNQGCPRIKVKFRIITGPYAAQNAKVTNNFNLIPSNANQLGFFFRHMEALGLPQSWFASLPPGQQAVHIAAQALLGRQGRIHVDDQREYNGRKQNDVTDVQPPQGGVTVSPMAQAPAQPMIPQPPGQFQQQAPGQPQFPQQPVAPQFPQQPQFAPQQPAPYAQDAYAQHMQQQQQPAAPQFQPPAPQQQMAPPQVQPPMQQPPAPPSLPFGQPGVPGQPQMAPPAPPGIPQPPAPPGAYGPPQPPQQAPQAPAFQPPAYQPPPQQGQPPAAPQQQQIPPPPPQQGGLPF